MATYESELEQEFEKELQELQEGEGETGEVGLEGEGILGAIGSALGGALGEGEGELQELQELEGEGELAHEFEGEFETGEQFFRKALRLVRRAAPLLKRVAKVAAPMVATAIGGPFGGLIAKGVSSLLEGEGELPELGELQETHELEGEWEGAFESEFEGEGEAELAHEIAQHEITAHEFEAEIMAQEAAQEQHELESEAMAGVAGITVISPADRRALRRVLPHMVRGIVILTRLLRRRRITRPAVRAVPTIVRQSVRTLRKQTAAGTPLTRKLVARTTANQVRRIIGNPRLCAAAIARNVRTTRAAQTRSTGRMRPVAG